MTINRRSFFASLAAVVVAPAVPVPAMPAPHVDPRALAASIRQLQADIAQMQAFLDAEREAFRNRPTLNLDELSQYRKQIENTVRQNTKPPCGS